MNPNLSMCRDGLSITDPLTRTQIKINGKFFQIIRNAARSTNWKLTIEREDLSPTHAEVVEGKEKEVLVTSFDGAFATVQIADLFATISKPKGG